jgi:hypothetical protein
VIALPTVPASVAATVEGAKFWKQPSIVTETGKRLESKVAGRCAKWNLGKELATLTLPYHSADTSLQQFHGAQRQRRLLAQAARDARQGGPAEVNDLSDDATDAEVKTELLQNAYNAPVDLTAAGQARGNVKVVDLFSAVTGTGIVDLTGVDLTQDGGPGGTVKGTLLKRRRTDV